jgi:putative membrane protein
MGAFLVRMLISAAGLWVASVLIPGMDISGMGTLLAAAFLLGLVNALVKPVLIFLTLPLTILTLGLFLLVINAALLGLVAWLLPGFVLGGFFPALFGSLIVSVISWCASRYVGKS